MPTHKTGNVRRLPFSRFLKIRTTELKGMQIVTDDKTAQDCGDKAVHDARLRTATDRLPAEERQVTLAFIHEHGEVLGLSWQERRSFLA